jgi:carbamate kinase
LKLVVALGGHALAPGGSAPLAQQEAAVARAAHELASLAREHELLVTHGNGPQIGWLANLSHSSGAAANLDLLGALTQGMLGYWLARELGAALPQRRVTALLTRVEVDPRDPAFGAPSKPIGPVLTPAEAEALRARGAAVHRTHAGLRRVVASPAPVGVLELDALRLLWDSCAVVVCAGGGGIPVARDAAGTLRGAECVIDKDATAALVANALGADGLLLLTDVAAVYADWPDRARAIRRATRAELASQRFEPGSMAPKVEAACSFARVPNRRAWIGAFEDARALLSGSAGTEVVSDLAAPRSLSALTGNVSLAP